jgi:hypothetical protein
MRFKTLAAAAAGGALLVGSAWAGVGLVPVTTSANNSQRDAGGPEGAASVTSADPAAVTDGLAKLKEMGTGEGETLGLDEAFVGASKVDLYPQPDATKGEVWEKQPDKCIVLNEKSFDDPQQAMTHVADWTRSPWPENPNCLYMGGFGLGPSQPIVEFDKTYGLWVRTVAVSRADKTLILTLIDAEGYNGLFTRMCPHDAPRCGSHEIAADLSAEPALAAKGVTPAGIVIASTHAHSAMDLIGGWGGVPEWYMRQVANAIRQSIREAVANQVPAVIEGGDVLARGYNSERRDGYYSAEDPTLNWFRAVGRNQQVVATVGAFAAHATSFGGSATVAHADWPGIFAKTIEDRTPENDMAVVFQAGLGNMSARGNNGGSMGKELAKLIPGVGQGTPVKAPNVSVAMEEWNQPVTNGPLGGAGAAGFFDRRFEPTPSSVEVAKS